jgi:hypothetical protein
MPASGVIPMKCHDILRDEGLADDEQITVTRGPEPRDRPAGVGIDVRRRNLDRCQPSSGPPNADGAAHQTGAETRSARRDRHQPGNRQDMWR